MDRYQLDRIQITGRLRGVDIDGLRGMDDY
jgi:hypothetical protein